jgi:radical SAM protein with 4Fe4S-binding SPASM domain
MGIGIVLIHGYTGSPLNLQPVAEKLISEYGKDSVKNLSLPGHEGGAAGQFDEDEFTDHISQEISKFRKENRKIVILGHSTGGNLALSCMRKEEYYPELLILAGVPYRVDSSTQERWSNHRKGKIQVPFISIAKMISMINRTARQEYLSCSMSSLIITGEEDRLVLPSDAFKWSMKFQEGKTRLVMSPETDHDIFSSAGSPFVIDVILRTIADLNNENTVDILKLMSEEPEARDFIAAFPVSGIHLADSPSGKKLTGSPVELRSFSKNEPVFANIEITTKCNFRCKYCARPGNSNNAVEMDKVTFRRILDLLPHSYRVTLVGLGEPLLHPEVIDFIKTASSLKRRVGLVTNASLLDSSISRELVSAGLNSIAFSLDTVSQDVASLLRKGTDIEKVIENIRRFIKIANDAGPMAKAVFTALSIDNIRYLNDLVDTVSTLGIDILMLTDLNFRENADKTIWKNANDEMITGLRKSVKLAFIKKLPVLSVHALEEFGLRNRYGDFLLLSPDQLFHRSLKRRYCFSPWQTVPVNVNGDITICDCQPEYRAGNILTDPFNEIWQGKLMTDFRKRMISDSPPDVCRICPRF